MGSATLQTLEALLTSSNRSCGIYYSLYATFLVRIKSIFGIVVLDALISPLLHSIGAPQLVRSIAGECNHLWSSKLVIYVAHDLQMTLFILGSEGLRSNH